jgi:nucleotide-binding universal stress UspA family protein
MNDSTTTPVIVVGADGSDQSIEALRWAADQARLTDARLVVVTGYEPPVTIMFVPTWTEEDYALEAEKALEHTVVEALGPNPDVRVERRLVQRRPAHALTEASRGASLLVVGSHGRGELPGMHLGSVAGYCVHHAPCPVLVVRRTENGR